MISTKDPVIALVAVLDQRNQPIFVKNYLVEARFQEDLEDSKAVSLENQLLMLVYQGLDVINEQHARIKGAKENEINKKLEKDQPELAVNTSCFIGLLFEAHVCDFELDVYAFISNTRYKYILIKNDQHQIQKNLGSISHSAIGNAQSQNQR